jgi:hypothetical protein
VVTTTAASGLSSTSVTTGGNVTDERGDPVTARGVCWSTSSNPTLSDNYTADGGGAGAFTSSITGLTPGTTYYVRAYATNGVGTTYGNEISFETHNVPTVTTSAPSYTIGGNVTSGGDVTYAGGVSVTARGICWNTTGSPTLADSYTTDGSGTGVFPSSLSGLTLGVTYYIRAYATNSVGTAYGNQTSIFTIALGDSYGGGTVIHVDGTLQHGLIASNADISASSAWSNILLNAGTNNSNGSNNTTLIIGQAGHTASAALLCRNYNGGGFTDWYLPSRDEFTIMNTNRAYLAAFVGNYWTSSESAIPIPGQSATRYIVATGTSGNSKSNLYKVRAIRQF